MRKRVRRALSLLLRPKRRKRPRPPRGAPPGTLIADPDAPAPVISAIAYGADELIEEEIENPRELRAFLDRWPVTWINIDGLGDAETVRALGELFGLHRLALEDVLNVTQRPKVEEYPGNLYIVLRMPYLNAEGRLETEQLSLFLGERFVITFQERAGDSFDPVRDRLRKQRGQIRQLGTDYLAYTLIDAVLDSYFPILEEFGEQLDGLELQIVADPDPLTVVGIHRAKRDLLALRRSIWPTRDMLNALVRDDTPLITSGTRLFLRDVYDHAVQIMDLSEVYRELGSGLTDFYMSSVSNRMNEVMKVLTIIATIFIPLSFLAGVYGMNFNPDVSPLNMPELNWRFGYPFALGLMVAFALGLLYYFRRKGWLGGLGVDLRELAESERARE